MSQGIHPTALVDPKAELAADVEVGPYTVIGPRVRIGAGTKIGPHCVIHGVTSIGRDNRIHAHASLGGPPQDKKYAGEETELVIGDRNTIREFTTFNTGTRQDAGVTRLGDDNWIMAYVHLAHDCFIGNQTILANNAQLAGHVHVGDWAILGGFTAVHQFCRIGAHSMTGMATALPQDLPPFMMASGNLARVVGFNVEGLKRRGFSPARIAAVKAMHRALYRQGLPLDRAKQEIASLKLETPEAGDDVDTMITFLDAASRGIVR
jgi:UDP-N-acetylglucosamine acyltransferase